MDRLAPSPPSSLEEPASISSLKSRLGEDTNSSALGATTSAPVVQVPTEPLAHGHLWKVPGWLPWYRLQDVPRLLRQGYPCASNVTECGNVQPCVVGPAVTLSRTIFGGLRSNADPRNLRCKPAFQPKGRVGICSMCF